jgi:hypothetical protein
VRKLSAQLGAPCGITRGVLFDRANSVVTFSFSELAAASAARAATKAGVPLSLEPGVALSGTIEEIENHTNAGKPTLIYFSSANVPHDVDLEQLNAVRAVRKHYEALGLLQRFKDVDEFKSQFSRHLATLMAEHLGAQSQVHATARTSTGNYGNDSLIQTHFFELLKQLDQLLPERDTRRCAAIQR